MSANLKNILQAGVDVALLDDVSDSNNEGVHREDEHVHQIASGEQRAQFREDFVHELGAEHSQHLQHGLARRPPGALDFGAQEDAHFENHPRQIVFERVARQLLQQLDNGQGDGDAQHLARLLLPLRGKVGIAIYFVHVVVRRLGRDCRLQLRHQLPQNCIFDPECLPKITILDMLFFSEY